LSGFDPRAPDSGHGERTGFTGRDRGRSFEQRRSGPRRGERRTRPQRNRAVPWSAPQRARPPAGEGGPSGIQGPSRRPRRPGRPEDRERPDHQASLRVYEKTDSRSQIQDSEWMLALAYRGFMNLEFGIFNPIPSPTLKQPATGGAPGGPAQDRGRPPGP